MENMSKRRRSLATTKGKDTSRRAKPLVAGAGYMGGELLIHIGIDTVKMDGKGFTKKVSDGDKVHAGDILVEADLEEIKNAGSE